MAKRNQRGSKSQRQNQHVRRLMMKIERHKKRKWNVEGMERELAFCVGDKERLAFKTGRVADERFSNFRGDVRES